jgi:hypothetical protein
MTDLAAAARDPRVPVGPLAAPIVIEQLPQDVNLILKRGDDFYLTIAVDDLDGQPADLTGAAVRAQIRAQTESPDVLGDLAPVIEDNVITVFLTSPVSASLPLSTVYDVELTDAQARVTTLIAGTITLRPDVTRD